MIFKPFEERVLKLLAYAKAEKLPNVEGFMWTRTWPQQDLLYALGRTVKNQDGFSADKPLGDIITNAKGGDSWHNYGLAVDLVWRDKGNWSWVSPHWIRLGEIGESVGLEWGGRWKAPVKPDLPHFELRGVLTIVRAKELYKLGGIEKVWEEVKI